MNYYITAESDVKILVQDLNPCGAKTVFFIHGWPLNHKMFEYQFNILPQYGFRCVSIDLRGFGGSDYPWEGYSYNRMADDVRAVIESLDVSDLTLAGFSVGGAIAIRYMSRHAGYKVSKLALLSAAAPSFTRRPGNPFAMTRNAVDQLILQTYADRPQMVADFGKLFFASQVSPSLRSWFQTLNLECSGHATIKVAKALRDENLSYDLGQIRVPTGIFHGALDKICPFELAQLMHRGIGGSVLYRFEQSGHAVFYDELNLFNHTFLNFLNSPA